MLARPLHVSKDGQSRRRERPRKRHL